MTSFETGTDTSPRSRGGGIPIAAGRRRLNESYGRLVSWLKLVLPTMAMVLLALLFIWPFIEESSQQVATVLTGAGQIISEHMEVSQARYSGVGEDGQRYTVTAEQVQQATVDAIVVAFVEPRADIHLSDGTWALVTAETGTLDRESQILELQSAVNLFHDLGYEFLTESATLDLMGGSAYGFEPVTGQGPFGYIEAEGFQILNRGEQVQLTGKSRVVLYNTD